MKLARWQSLEGCEFRGRRTAGGNLFLESVVPGEVGVSRLVMGQGEEARTMAVERALGGLTQVHPELAREAPALYGRLRGDARQVAETVPLEGEWELSGRELLARVERLTGSKRIGYEESAYLDAGQLPELDRSYARGAVEFDSCGVEGCSEKAVHVRRFVDELEEEWGEKYELAGWLPRCPEHWREEAREWSFEEDIVRGPGRLEEPVLVVDLDFYAVELAGTAGELEDGGSRLATPWQAVERVLEPGLGAVSAEEVEATVGVWRNQFLAGELSRYLPADRLELRQSEVVSWTAKNLAPAVPGVESLADLRRQEQLGRQAEEGSEWLRRTARSEHGLEP